MCSISNVRGREGFVTLPYRGREVSAPQELSGRCDCGPSRGHRVSAKRAADAGLADDLHELALAGARAFPTPHEEVELLRASDERGERPPAAAPAAAARAHDAIERDRLRQALELMLAFVLGDEQPGDLALYGGGDEDCAGFGRRLHARGDIRCLAEHFARSVDDDRSGFEADAGGKLGRAERALRALRSASARWIASAARTARSASFSCACG